MSTAEGVDAGVEVAVRVNQGYCIYAGCFPINVIPPPLGIIFDIGLSQLSSRFPSIGVHTNPAGGTLGRETRTHGGKPGYGLIKKGTVTSHKLNTATAWLMGDGLGAPFAIGQACENWFDAADKLGQARMRLEQLAGSLTPQQWSGKDRDGFNEEITQLAQQIGDAETFARIVAGTLVGAVVPLGAWPIGCTIVGVIQFVNASLFYAAVASIVGNLGPSEALYASGLATSVTCNRIFSTSTLALKIYLGVCAGVIAGAAVWDAMSQESHGDEDATTDLQRAVIEMAVEQGVKNLAASGIDALTPWPVDIAHQATNPEEYLGKNNDPYQEAVDEANERAGDPADRAGNETADVILGEDKPDGGPFSG